MTPGSSWSSNRRKRQGRPPTWRTARAGAELKRSNQPPSNCPSRRAPRRIRDIVGKPARWVPYQGERREPLRSPSWGRGAWGALVQQGLNDRPQGFFKKDANDGLEGPLMQHGDSPLAEPSLPFAHQNHTRTPVRMGNRPVVKFRRVSHCPRTWSSPPIGPAGTGHPGSERDPGVAARDQHNAIPQSLDPSHPQAPRRQDTSVHRRALSVHIRAFTRRI